MDIIFETKQEYASLSLSLSLSPTHGLKINYFWKFSGEGGARPPLGWLIDHPHPDIGWLAGLPKGGDGLRPPKIWLGVARLLSQRWSRVAMHHPFPPLGVARWPQFGWGWVIEGGRMPPPAGSRDGSLATPPPRWWLAATPLFLFFFFQKNYFLSFIYIFFPFRDIKKI